MIAGTSVAALSDHTPETNLVDLYRAIKAKKLAEYHATLHTDIGRVSAGIAAAIQVKDAVFKVRHAPKRHRLLVGLREVGRVAGRVHLGPLWILGEAIVKGFRKRRKSTLTLTP